jgi:hypothetical protein
MASHFQANTTSKCPMKAVIGQSMGMESNEVAYSATRFVYGRSKGLILEVQTGKVHLRLSRSVGRGTKRSASLMRNASNDALQHDV